MRNNALKINLASWQARFVFVESLLLVRTAIGLKLGEMESINTQTGKAREEQMKILMVITSHDQLGNTGRKTGFWLEEFAAPYFVFKDAEVQITLASPKGGQPPLDPKAISPKIRHPQRRASRTAKRPNVPLLIQQSFRP
jgi:hypothetical protein